MGIVLPKLKYDTSLLSSLLLTLLCSSWQLASDETEKKVLKRMFPNLFLVTSTTGPFTNPEPRIQEIGESYVVRKRRASDFDCERVGRAFPLDLN